MEQQNTEPADGSNERVEQLAANMMAVAEGALLTDIVGASMLVISIVSANTNNPKPIVDYVRGIANLIEAGAAVQPNSIIVGITNDIPQ